MMRFSPSPPHQLPVVIRRVWDYNLVQEIHLIRKCLQYYPLASFDTEFPGTVYNPVNYRNPTELYDSMKKNVDGMKIIQLGLTLSDERGALPNFLGYQYIWEFNFRDFDCDFDLQNPDSIALLRRQGIDFEMNRKNGINSKDFAALFLVSGLVSRVRSRTWVTFHGLYDFAYLIKVLTQQELPSQIGEFIDLVKNYFGEYVYDLKKILGSVGIYGGLEKTAEALAVTRGVGRSHQAGSDSLLTMRAFLRTIYMKPATEMAVLLQSCNHKLYGCGETV